MGWRATSAACSRGAICSVRSLAVAAAMRADGQLEKLLKERYSSWDSGLGAEIEAGKHSLKSLEAVMIKQGDCTANTSGRQEMIENLINTYL